MKEKTHYPLNMLCRVCRVSRSGYYRWRKAEESPRARANRRLLVHIRSIFNESRKTYGVIRVHRELQDAGQNCGKNRVYALMRKDGLKSVHRRKYRMKTTDSKHPLPIAENVIHRDFTAHKPNQKWGSDISYVHTKEGFIYLAIILDFFSRKIVGYALGDSLDAGLCCNALQMALQRRRCPQNLVHHSDRGVQYASAQYRQMLAQASMTQSMSRKGNCYDNAIVESFFHTLKVECVYQNEYLTRQDAEKDIKRYIEVFYNAERRHSALDYQSPVQYEFQAANAA